MGWRAFEKIKIGPSRREMNAGHRFSVIRAYEDVRRFLRSPLQRKKKARELAGNPVLVEIESRQKRCIASFDPINLG